MKPWRMVIGTTDEASCREVGRTLQRYLDAELDESTARRVRTHLDQCRRCGLDAQTYDEIKWALLHFAPPRSTRAIDRLRAYAHDLSSVGNTSNGP